MHNVITSPQTCHSGGPHGQVHVTLQIVENDLPGCIYVCSDFLFSLKLVMVSQLFSFTFFDMFLFRQEIAHVDFISGNVQNLEAKTPGEMIHTLWAKLELQ